LPKFIDIDPLNKTSLEKMGFSWHTDLESDYIVLDKFLQLSSVEVEAYVKATNEIYKMYETSAEYVVKNELFEELDIPPKLIPQIRKSWKKERGNHLYGRFDLSGGIDGKEIKLIEFNADTPTVLLESVVIQYMMLQYNKSVEAEQFNNIYDAISQTFLKIAKSQKGEYSRFLFSCVKDIHEEEVTTKLLESMAKDAGLITEFSFLEDTDVDNGFDFWFKLYPWEYMEDFQVEGHTMMLNPAYTLLYQSKGMLAILYKLFPNSPYLLKTEFQPIEEKYVQKRMFGREGANINIVENGEIITATDGLYAEYKSIYQEYTEFVKDKENNHYQAGVFYSNGACGISFRRGAEILDDKSQVLAHVVR